MRAAEQAVQAPDPVHAPAGHRSRAGGVLCSGPRVLCLYLRPLRSTSRGLLCDSSVLVLRPRLRPQRSRTQVARHIESAVWKRMGFSACLMSSVFAGTFPDTGVFFTQSVPRFFVRVGRGI